MREMSSRLDTTGNQEDTLGMTPLHILACSSVHDIEMYRIILEKYPDNLITKDIWGELFFMPFGVKHQMRLFGC